MILAKPLSATLLLALLLLGGTAASAEDTGDDRAKAYAREQLLREATRVVRPDQIQPTDLEAAKAALAADMALRASWQAGPEAQDLLKDWEETIAARRMLLGDPQRDDAEGMPVPATEGALQQGRRLLRWMLADAPGVQGCGVIVGDARALDLRDRARGFTYPLPPDTQEGTTPTEPEAATPSMPVPAGPPPPEDGAPSPAPLPATTPAPLAPVPTPPAKPEAGAPPTIEGWARAVRAAIGGSLRNKQLAPAVCDDVSLLTQAESVPTPIREASIPGFSLRRRALESPEPFAYNAVFVALRTLQANERVEAFRADVPDQGIVDDVTLREKSQRAEELAQGLAALKNQRDELRAQLDEMVRDLDNWKTMAALLATRIEDRRAEIAPPTPAPPHPGNGAAPPDLALRVLSAQESTVSLEMRLLYLAATRSEVRLGILNGTAKGRGLLERLIQVANDEVAAARASENLYEEELARVRRARRIDRLAGEARPLLGRLKALGPAEGLSPDATERLQAYRSLLSMNEIVQESAERRRALGEWALQLPAKKTGAPIEGDSVAFARDPDSTAWDAATLGRWRELLARPAFDKQLVAEHYATSERRLGYLRTSLASAVGIEALRTRYAAATEAVKQRLAALAARRDYVLRTFRLPELVQTWERDFEDSLEGVQKETDRIRERQALIRGYQQNLLDLGARSFAIRVNRNLDTADLGGAASDTLAGLEQARRWAMLEDPERNAWQFVRQHWAGMLAVLAAILLAIGGTPWVRRRLEHWLARRAARYPQLEWSGASISREREEAKARKEQSEAVVAAREAELLNHLKAEMPTPDAPAAAPLPAPLAPTSAPLADKQEVTS